MKHREAGGIDNSYPYDDKSAVAVVRNWLEADGRNAAPDIRVYLGERPDSQIADVIATVWFYRDKALPPKGDLIAALKAYRMAHL